jgi:hypothetical protein
MSVRAAFIVRVGCGAGSLGVRAARFGAFQHETAKLGTPAYYLADHVLESRCSRLDDAHASRVL